MIMMMLLTMTMKRWPEANLSPDLGRTRQVSGSLRQQMRCFSRPNNPPCTHLISFYQCAMPQIKGKQGTSIWDVYFVWLHKMTGKMSTFELQANMSAKMIIIKVTNGLTWPWPLIQCNEPLPSTGAPGQGQGHSQAVVMVEKMVMVTNALERLS